MGSRREALLELTPQPRGRDVSCCLDFRDDHDRKLDVLARNDIDVIEDVVPVGVVVAIAFCKRTGWCLVSMEQAHTHIMRRAITHLGTDRRIAPGRSGMDAAALDVPGIAGLEKRRNVALLLPCDIELLRHQVVVDRPLDVPEHADRGRAPG